MKTRFTITVTEALACTHVHHVTDVAQRLPRYKLWDKLGSVHRPVL